MYAEEDTEANDNNYYYCDSASTVSTPTSATEGTSCTDSTTSHPSRTFVQEGSYAAVVRDVNPVNPFFIYDTRDNNQRHNGTKDSEDARLEVEVRL
ncbi:hypothetical protein AGDE_16863 [Angomonas deanei]|uniref:Uncharacterized protein n=1 Tax=Angomonas deanei TaxID=59799 RepID=A0A7G2C2N4_9TRYP|nr:hypothetical protein AGDE_16863 [Angomonas deanei]CAD2213916.1 hypothetical protein, conserved [Angomonas deanei]|eukprot:EPY16028.1 hypothetical protein AGDE_16863 [Angomonas deanei]